MNSLTQWFGWLAAAAAVAFAVKDGEKERREKKGTQMNTLKLKLTEATSFLNLVMRTRFWVFGLN